MATQLAALARPLAIQLAVLLRLAGRELPDVDRSAAIYAGAAAAFDLDSEALAQLAPLRHGEDGIVEVSELFGRVQVAASRAARGRSRAGGRVVTTPDLGVSGPDFLGL